jgi:hypothetical protein
MSRRDLKYKSIDLSVDNSLELLDDCGMEFVEFVVGEHLADELPQDDLFARTFLGLFMLELFG